MLHCCPPPVLKLLCRYQTLLRAQTVLLLQEIGGIEGYPVFYLYQSAHLPGKGLHGNLSARIVLSYIAHEYFLSLTHPVYLQRALVAAWCFVSRSKIKSVIYIFDDAYCCC